MAEFPDSLLNDPNVINKAAAAGITPVEFLRRAMEASKSSDGGILKSLEASPTALAAPPVLDIPAPNLDGAAMRVRGEQGILSANLSERGNLERQIGRLETSVDTEDDIRILAQMRKKLTDLGGPTAGSANSPEYDNAANDYLAQLRALNVTSASNSPKIRAAQAELDTTNALLAGGTLTPDLQQSLQDRNDAATTALGGALDAQAASVADANNAPLSLTNPVNGSVLTTGTLTEEPVLSEPQEGFHRMPDGSMMADAEMSGSYGPYPPRPALAEQEIQPSAPPALEAPAIRNGLTPNPSAMGAADPYAPPVGVLEDQTASPAKAVGVLNTASNSTSGGALSSTATSLGSDPQRPTGNARGSSMAYGKIGIGEQMMRAGLKGLAASDQGMSASLGAVGQSYGETQDANRATAIAEAQAQETTRLAEARMRAAAAGKAKDNAPTVQTAVYQQAALTALDQIQSYLDADGDLNPFDNVTGIIGNVFSSVPGTNAHNVGQAILTVEAAVGFDRLQFMRDNSKTGGALGQVSNIELQLLKSSLGALRQSQTKEAFQTNVNAVRKHYKDAVAKIQQYQAEDQRIANGGAPAAIQQNTTVNKSDLDYING
jgi:hypothetical protein